MKIYYSMKGRCYNKNDCAYRFYGEKGIKVCDEWLNNPFSFEQWALSNGYDDNLTIDRKESDKDYSPENCRWITFNDNAKYKSSTKITTVDGESHTGKEWAKILNLGTNTINRMLREHDENTVEDFIRARKNDMTKTCGHNQSWL